jgi:transposase-like protein
MSDYQWCMERGIKPGTFYNWVKRIRKSGCSEIPATVHRQNPEKQEIVRIAFEEPAKNKTTDLSTSSAEVVWEMPKSGDHGLKAIELTLAGATLRIPNGTDPMLLEQTIRLLKGLLC